MNLIIKNYHPPYQKGQTRCFALRGIKNHTGQEVYPSFANLFNNFNIAKYPDILTHILNTPPGQTWRGYNYGFHRGPLEYLDYGVEPVQSLTADEVFAYDGESEGSIVPLVHFYEVILLHAAEVLRIVKEEGILSFWKREEPYNYRENWELEMNRLMGLIRQAWEMEKSK